MAEIIVQVGQSLLDIAVTYYGNAEGIFDIVSRNKLNGPIDNIYPGDVLSVTDNPERGQIVNFMASHTVATIQKPQRAEGIGWMQIAGQHDSVFEIT